MFGLSMAELVVVAVVALIVLGPEKLPTVMRTLAKAYAQLGRLKAEFNRAVEANLAPLQKELDLEKKKWTPELGKLTKGLEKLEVDKSIKDLLDVPQDPLPDSKMSLQKDSTEGL
jgi:sec-independent protein translocase protein TatB